MAEPARVPSGAQPALTLRTVPPAAQPRLRPTMWSAGVPEYARALTADEVKAAFEAP
jgi:hypothetical protein